MDEILTYAGDTAFVREMYPKLLTYYKWWFAKRDHNGNGMCEFGSTDGTLEAAGWESGMDNAIRFDGARMLRNGPDAWSLDQESVDLNAYLAFEARLLRKFAALIGEDFDAPDHSAEVADYFFYPEIGYFCDRKLADGSFIAEPACEGYTPFWVEIASQEQMDQALRLLRTIPSAPRTATGAVPSGSTRPIRPSAGCATTGTAIWPMSTPVRYSTAATALPDTLPSTRTTGRTPENGCRPPISAGVPRIC